MKRTAVLFFVLLMLAAAGGIHADENYVTVYNNDLGLIKQVRDIRITDAKQPVRFSDVAAELIPTSVHLRSVDGQPFEVLEQNFEYDLVSSNKILDKYLDHPVTIIRKNGEVVSGTLLSQQGGLVVRTDQGIKLLNQSNETAIEVGRLPEGFFTRPTLIWELAGAKPGQRKVEVSYLTRGMSWQAEYVGVVNEAADRLDLKAWVSVDNHCGATFKNATLKLVAGDVHQAPRHDYGALPTRHMTKLAAGAAQFEERGFFEYHIYELERPTTVKENQIKQVSLFPERSVSCKKQYTYHPQKDDKKVNVRLVFKNTKKAGLGDPLPAGVFRIYQMDGKGLEFTGEDRIGHTPRNEKVEITLGSAFELKGERKVTDYHKISDRAEKETIEIELRNNKPKESVTIKVEERMRHRDWKIEQSTHRLINIDIQTLGFEVPVKADGKTTLRYTVRYNW